MTGGGGDWKICENFKFFLEEILKDWEQLGIELSKNSRNFGKDKQKFGKSPFMEKNVIFFLQMPKKQEK